MEINHLVIAGTHNVATRTLCGLATVGVRTVDHDRLPTSGGDRCSECLDQLEGLRILDRRVAGAILG